MNRSLRVAITALTLALLVTACGGRGPSQEDVAAFTEILQHDKVEGTPDQWKAVAQQICDWAKDGDALEGILQKLQEKGYTDEEAISLHAAAVTTYCKEYAS